jgi:DNA invertase Pin-like site-specific DNA recombinase
VQAERRQAGLYCRVSTDEQAESGTSLDVQLEKCRAYASARDLNAREYMDAGVSGSLDARPALDRLLADVRARLLDVVVVAKFDRFGRSLHFTAQVIHELEALGVEFVSIEERVDNTPAGRFQRNVLLSVAELEREVIRDRMVSGVTAIARQGFWPGGPPPFGYKVVRGERHASLAIEPDEAETIRRIAECMVDQRMSTLETARHLNALARPPRRLGRWTSQSLRHVAQNGTGWSGRWEYRRSARKGKRGRDPHGKYGPPIWLDIPAILTPERHEAVKAALARTSTGPVGKKNPYVLSGLITSPHGANFQGVTRPGGLALMRCAGAHTQLPPEERCSCRTIVVPVVEKLVWDEVTRVLSDPDELQTRAETVLAGMDSMQPGEDLAGLRRRVAGAQKALGDAYARALKLDLDDQALAHATAQLSDDLEIAKVRLAKAEAWARTNSDTRSRVERIWSLADSARRNLDSDDPALRRRILEVLGVRVRVAGWETCPTCNGGGLVAAEPDSITGKRKKGMAGARVCPTCHRTRHVPMLTISGEIPDASSLGGAPAGNPGWPFEVVAGAS